MPLVVKPLSPALGAEVVGVDLREELREETVAEIVDAWHRHLVLLFREQSLSEDDQIRFAQHFGVLQKRTRPPEARNEDAFIQHPEFTMLVSNIRENGKLIGSLPDGEMHFHSDQCYLEKPAKGTFLYAMEVPSEGGDTLFLNMYDAYEKLPAEIKTRIDGRKALNAYLYDSTTRNMNGSKLDLTAHPHYVQPVVRTHPDTRRKALYVNRLMTWSIEGMDENGRQHPSRSALLAYRARSVHLRPPLARRRSGAVGQPLHLARAHGFQRQGAPHAAASCRHGRPGILNASVSVGPNI